MSLCRRASYSSGGRGSVKLFADIKKRLLKQKAFLFLNHFKYDGKNRLGNFFFFLFLRFFHQVELDKGKRDQ